MMYLGIQRLLAGDVQLVGAKELGPPLMTTCLNTQVLSMQHISLGSLLQ